MLNNFPVLLDSSEVSQIVSLSRPNMKNYSNSSVLYFFFIPVLFQNFNNTLIASVPRQFLNVMIEFYFTTLSCSFWQFWFSSFQHLWFHRKM